MSALSSGASASGPSMDGTALAAASAILASGCAHSAVIDQDPCQEKKSHLDTVDYSRLPGYCR